MKVKVAAVFGLAVLAYLASIAAVFAQQFNFGSSFAMNSVQVDTLCDGPHKMYLARVKSFSDAPSPISLFVLKNGCVRPPAEEK
jgi:hypothetical protein